ncbi:hypothetical protein AVEN_211998-1 [Araneus ventricosus]|uniref:Mutator-like transposase domain-containing protein n=1 Tax=Araneus ventricosus TaxID=182803 RepID=A0A4Y2VIS8_ARAVE|nr:hypothetical protein AVEN_211998-1 [Araneus ventricosus]
MRSRKQTERQQLLMESSLAYPRGKEEKSRNSKGRPKLERRSDTRNVKTTGYIWWKIPSSVCAPTSVCTARIASSQRVLLLQRNSEINTRFVFALRIIGKGFTAAKKLYATLNLPAFLSKDSFRIQELKLLHASVSVAENSMKHAAGEIRNADDPVPSMKCGLSVDGTWQRRGYSSLNVVVSAISILRGKVIDMEVVALWGSRSLNLAAVERNLATSLLRPIGALP